MNSFGFYLLLISSKRIIQEWEEKAAKAKKEYAASMKEYEASGQGSGQVKDKKEENKEKVERKKKEKVERKKKEAKKESPTKPASGSPFKSKEYISDDDSSSDEDTKVCSYTGCSKVGGKYFKGGFSISKLFKNQ